MKSNSSIQHTSVCVDVSNVFNLDLTQEPHYVQKTPQHCTGENQSSPSKTFISATTQAQTLWVGFKGERENPNYQYIGYGDL